MDDVKDIDEIIRLIRRSELKDNEKFKLEKVKVGEKFHEAKEAVMKEAVKYMERNFPCFASENDASSVRELLKTAKCAHQKFRLGDSQVMSLLVSRADGALQKLLAKELSRQTPLDLSLIHI